MNQPKDETDEFGNKWVRFGGFEVHLVHTDEGIVVDIWPPEDGESDAPLASASAHRSDLDREV